MKMEIQERKRINLAEQNTQIDKKHNKLITFI